MIRVVVADDHHLVRQGICALLEHADDIEVVGEAENGQQALQLAECLAPDVLVMDISMPRLNGILAAEKIRVRRIPSRVVVLSMHSDVSLVRQALRNGAKGYVLKRSVTEELLLAIRAANRGETYLSPGICELLLPDMTRPGDWGQSSLFEALSPREQEVLQLIAEGNTNRTTAELMNISVKTVEKHRANLMEKLGVHDLAGLVCVAIKHGLIMLD